MKIQNTIALISVLTILTSCKTSPPRQETPTPPKGFVFVDHTYNTVYDRKFKKQLVAAGFTLNSRTVEHPGSLLCHFVGIGLPQFTDRTPYLEFCLVMDKKAYIESERKDPEAANKSLESLLQNKGLSFGYTGDFEAYIQELKKVRPDIEARFDHKNYEWKTNSTDRLPGWNFITLIKPPFQPDFYVWFTGYDPRNIDRSQELKEAQHKNGANRIAGLVVDLASSKEVEYMEGVTFKKFTDGKLNLDDGRQIINYAQLNPAEKKLFAKSPATYKAVLVEADPEKLDAISLPYESILYRGSKVKRLRFANYTWDIILIRGELAK